MSLSAIHAAFAPCLAGDSTHFLLFGRAHPAVVLLHKRQHHVVHRSWVSLRPVAFLALQQAPFYADASEWVSRFIAREFSSRGPVHYPPDWCRVWQMAERTLQSPSPRITHPGTIGLALRNAQCYGVGGSRVFSAATVCLPCRRPSSHADASR